jgi:excinuclease ABC subunit A
MSPSGTPAQKSRPHHPSDTITIRGAREHNLCDVSLDLPRDQLIVFTGLSGSGKSSLAFDTIYAEGQRRYVESLSAYARQFLGQMDKPDVDVIEGLSPAISIDQKSASRNPRSTVGTVTEIYDYLRLLFARVGVAHDPETGERLVRQTPQQIVDRILQLPEGTRFQVLAPVVRGRKGTYEQLFTDLAAQGFARVRVNGEVWGNSSTSSMIHSFEDMIAYISECETLHVGEFFGSGTMAGCCSLECDRWMKDGDVIEVEFERIGVLRNPVKRLKK